MNFPAKFQDISPKTPRAFKKRYVGRVLGPFTSALVKTLAPSTPLREQNVWISESLPGYNIFANYLI